MAVGTFAKFAAKSAAVAIVYGLAKYINAAAGPSPPAFHCYAGVRTHAHDTPTAKCFGVSSEGLFTQILGQERTASAHGSGAQQARVTHDNPGLYAVPGWWDGHGHILEYGEFLHSVDLFGVDSFDEARRRIREYVEQNPGAGGETRWIRGVGWDQVLLGRYPTADDLEGEGLAGLHMMLDRTDIHCNWVSHATLAIFTAGEFDRDIPGGEVVREPGMGVFCDNAMDMVVERWPAPDEATRAQFVRTAMKALNAVGIVGVHDAMVQPRGMALLEELARNRETSVRVYAMLKCEVVNAFCIENARRTERADGMFTARSAKIFADGALGSWGAAMLEPYSDRPGASGTLVANATTLRDITLAWAGLGYQVNIHAIGDLANRMAIDAIEHALRALTPNMATMASLGETQDKLRFRIEHAQMVSLADQERMRALRIIPSIQPTHATSDMAYALSRLGAERLAHSAYRMRSLADLGVCLGSDFPVEPPSPLHGMYAAVTRRSPRTGRGVADADADWTEIGWHTEEALTVDQAMRGFTTNVARAGFMEGRAGVIAPGAWADWVVLEEEVGDGMDAERLRTLKVKETWVGGRRVFPLPVADEEKTARGGEWLGWLSDGVNEFL